MKREDIEQLNILVPYCFETDLEEKWYNIGLKHGLEIADEEPNLERLWHDASEVPNENTSIVFIWYGNLIHKLEIIPNVDKLFYSWLTANRCIKQWAYIDDILPKGGKK